MGLNSAFSTKPNTDWPEYDCGVRPAAKEKSTKKRKLILNFSNLHTYKRLLVNRFRQGLLYLPIGWFSVTDGVADSWLS